MSTEKQKAENIHNTSRERQAGDRTDQKSRTPTKLLPLRIVASDKLICGTKPRDQEEAHTSQEMISPTPVDYRPVGKGWTSQ